MCGAVPSRTQREHAGVHGKVGEAPGLWMQHLLCVRNKAGRGGEYKKAVEDIKAAHHFDNERGAKCVVPYLPEHHVNMLVCAARWVVLSVRSCC